MSRAPHQSSSTKLAPYRALSSLLIAVTAWLMAVVPVSAHEIRPAIANVFVDADAVEIDILLALEPLVAGLDLDGLQDTNQSPLSDRYDALRALPPPELAQAFEQAWPQIAGGLQLLAGEQRLEPQVRQVQVDPVGNEELPRDSVLRLFADLPPDGSPVRFGWAASYGPLIVRQNLPEGIGYAGYLTSGALSDPIPRMGAAYQPFWRAFAGYVRIGFEHIVPKGLDHILFVLGLFFFSLRIRPLLKQVTAFTVAHTATLALAILGYVSAPAALVEPLIAASIVYVGVENVLWQTYRPWRTAVVFCFGLLHGLGFAAVLGDIGLDPARFVTGLVGFNIGVELGQLAVIAAAYLLVGHWFGKRPWYRDMLSVPASAAIAAVGAYWFFTRIVG